MLPAALRYSSRPWLPLPSGQEVLEHFTDVILAYGASAGLAAPPGHARVSLPLP